jgi:uncharacterized pyridoxamine 5'-phosphate oxidase family protein
MKNQKTKRRTIMDKQEVISYIKDVHIGFLATVGEDNSPRVRPIAVHSIYNNCLYFFTFGHTRKAGEMEAKPRIEVVWSKLEEQSQVRIGGNVALETNEDIHQKFIADNPVVTKMLPPEARHLFRLYRFTPETVEAAIGFVPYENISW